VDFVYIVTVVAELLVLEKEKKEKKEAQVLLQTNILKVLLDSRWTTISHACVILS
jgi:hypothetical protein